MSIADVAAVVERLGSVSQGVALLIEQRDELLASLREMAAMYDGMDDNSFWSPAVRAKVQRARAAVAKAEGR